MFTCIIILVNPMRSMKHNISNFLSNAKVVLYDCELRYSPIDNMTNL